MSTLWKHLKEKFSDNTTVSSSITPHSIEEAIKDQPTKLNLSKKNLTEIPEFIQRLSKLSYLDLSENKITNIPDWLGSSTNLGLLDLSGNLLTSVPTTIGRLSHLWHLNLSHNNLTAIPASICDISRLGFLDLSYNKLSSLPVSISQLSLLWHIDLSSNKFDTFPDLLNQLGQLAYINLSRNYLTTVPESIGNLKKLGCLDLSHNKLTSLPDALQSLSLLEQLYLRGNDALGLPNDILESAHSRSALRSKPAKIIAYYNRLKSVQMPLNEAKIIVVGRGLVGKTSIINRLINGQFNKDEEQTKGIFITEWQLRLRENEQVRLNVWDFGGQEIMHATHQFFFTKRSLYLLVLNGREGGEDTEADYWLKLIESFGGNSPVIVVLNKIKDNPFDLNRRLLQQKYRVVNFIKTDCKDGTGVEELRQVIERETDRLEDLRKAFPSYWFKIKDHLEGMKDNYLTFEEYRFICASLGEEDPRAQEDLAGYLHDLGIVLNYRDDPRLRDTHVLSPHWVTNGIYNILNSTILAHQKGEIKLNDLSGLLNKNKYPATMHRFLFDLMKKFDLCFAFPDDDTYYLIPELLDKQEPLETGQFDPKECLNFQYHYNILPEGLMPRFIVRSQSLSMELQRWRSGVFLQFEGNHALVKADIQEKKIFISVCGPVPGRRRLLAVIRSDFEHIHRMLPSLKAQEMVPLPYDPTVVVPHKELLVREKENQEKFTQVIGEQVIELDVKELLNGVELESVRRRNVPDYEKRKALRLFYSYSRKDEILRNELETHLKLLERHGLIDSWYDRNIEAGDDWETRIDNELEYADIILLLVSADFIASDYCYEKEMKRALARNKNGKAIVIPIILRDVNWTRAPFAGLQALPEKGLALTLWPNRDSGWRNISEGIEKRVMAFGKSSERSE